MTKLFRLGLLTCALFYVASACRVTAANTTWSGSTSGDWTTAGNWISSVPGSTVSLVNSDTATFNSAGNGNTTITIDPNRNLRSLTFDTSAVSYTIGSAGANAGNSLLLSSAGAITMAGTIAGTGLTQTINAPLILEPASATTNGVYTITNASTDATNKFVIAGNISAGTTTGAQTLTLSGVNTGNNIVSGAISNGGASAGLAVIKANAGTWILSGANTYTGSTSISSSGGTLVGIGEHAFGSTSGIFLSGNASTVLSLRGDSSTSFTKASDNSSYSVTSLTSAVAINVDQATVAGTGARTMTIGNLTIGSTGATFIQNFTGTNNTSLSVGAVTGGASTAAATTTLTNNIGGGGTLTLASYTSGNTSGGETVTFAGTGTSIVTGAITPGSTVLGLTKSGSGLLTLLGSNTYTGTTTVSAGMLATGGANKINDASVVNVSAAGAIFQIGGAETVGGLVGSGSVALGANTLTVATSAANTFSGVIGGSGGLTKTSSGTLTLSGANAYTGTTTIAGGVLATSGANRIADASVVNISGAGATLQIGGTETLGELVGTGTVALGSNTLTLSTAGTGTYGGSITGSGGLTKTGIGSATLSGTNSYTGLTTLTAGTLTLDFSAATAPVSNIINSTGTLSLNSITAGSATLNVVGKAGASNVQTFAASASNIGAFHINLTPGSGGSLTVNTGSMPIRSSGFTLDFGIQSGATVNVGTTGTSANGLLANLATINGTDFATKDGSNNVVAFTNYTNNTATTLSTAGNQVVDMSGGNTTLSGAGQGTSVSGLRFNTAGSTTISMDPTRMLVIGGGQAAGPILVTSNVGANTTTITGGMLSGISSRDLIVLQNNTAGALQIDSVITSLNANNLGFTKAGLGEVLLTASNAYSANTYVNEGKVTVAGDVVVGNTQTLTTTVGSGTLTGVDTTGLFVGQRVYSLNTGTASSGLYIASISGNTVVLSGNATASGGVDVTFANAGGLGFMTGSNAVQVGAAATLQIGNGGTTGSLVAGQGILNNGTVALDRSNAFTFSNTITGSGSVVQAGSGATTLEGVQGYTGATVINAGTLLINGTALSSAATVNSGGSLGGSGTVGSITVNAGGAITPGNSIGQLNTNGNLTWNGQTSGAFGQMKFELDTLSSSSDLLNLGTGMLDQGTGLVFAFDFLGTGAEGFTYTLITFASTDFTVDDFSYSNLASGLTGSFIQNADNLQFVVSAIPEPSTVALAGLGLALMLSRIRRRA